MLNGMLFVENVNQKRKAKNCLLGQMNKMLKCKNCGLELVLDITTGKNPLYVHGFIDYGIGCTNPEPETKEVV